MRTLELANSVSVMYRTPISSSARENVQDISEQCSILPYFTNMFVNILDLEVSRCLLDNEFMVLTVSLSFSAFSIDFQIEF